MVNTEHKEILEQILALLDTACQGSLELLAQYEAGNSRAAAQLLEDLLAVTGAVKTAQQPLLPQLEYAYTAEMLENVEDTLEDIRHSMEAGNAERAAMKMEFQLYPFLRQLREAFYFWGAVYPEREAMDRYYRDEFAVNFQNPYIRKDEPSEFTLSVAVPAYNHLDVTKRCIEHLLKETDFEKLNAELILIDHGSSDGTLEYFESLGVGKVIHFKHNVRMYMLTTLFQICRGKYFAFINNDVLVTRNWAAVLLGCLQSDGQIAVAIPATPHTANLQSLGLPDAGAENFIAWADGQNRPDPLRWDERARLMPTLGMYRAEAVNAVGFADPYFYTMEFWDDDFSLRARRAGYRQIACNDAACYHFGSVTSGEAQRKENTLALGRRLFMEKNGVDAWGTGFCYDYNAIQLFGQASTPQKEVFVLGIDCGMGDTVMQIRNELKRTGREGKIFHITTDRCYLPDLRPHAEDAVCIKPELLSAVLTDVFPGVQFDYVFIGLDLAGYFMPFRLLEALAGRMTGCGELVGSFSNPFFAGRLYQMLHFTLPASPIQLLHPEQVKQEAERCFSSVSLTGLAQPVQGLKEFVTQHYGKKCLDNSQKSQLEVMQYYIRCGKRPAP